MQDTGASGLRDLNGGSPGHSVGAGGHDRPGHRGTTGTGTGTGTFGRRDDKPRWKRNG